MKMLKNGWMRSGTVSMNSKAYYELNKRIQELEGEIKILELNEITQSKRYIELKASLRTMNFCIKTMFLHKDNACLVKKDKEMTRSAILTEVAGIRQALNSARWVLNEEDIQDIAKIILRATERNEIDKNKWESKYIEV